MRPLPHIRLNCVLCLFHVSIQKGGQASWKNSPKDVILNKIVFRVQSDMIIATKMFLRVWTQTLCAKIHQSLVQDMSIAATFTKNTANVSHVRKEMSLLSDNMQAFHKSDTTIEEKSA